MRNATKNLEEVKVEKKECKSKRPVNPITGFPRSTILRVSSFVADVHRVARRPESFYVSRN